jgi:hypothetical protein
MRFAATHLLVVLCIGPLMPGALAQDPSSSSADQDVWTCLLNHADHTISFSEDRVKVTPLAGGLSAELKIKTN